ncbi:MAG: YIP1 family protein [Acidobacteriota bacterium]|nr:YIP1 family protein [Acidobacteriota bacterium]
MEATSSVPPPPAAPTAAAPIPWEDPARTSTFERFVETVKLLATRPGEAFAGMPTAGGIGSPLLYAIVVGWIGIAIAVVWNMLFQGMWIPFMGGGEEAAIMAGFTAAWAVGLIILAPIFVIIGVFIGAAILHLMLMIVGGAYNGFEATVRVVCYAQTAQLAGIIPFCGGLISMVWAIILYVIGLATAHRTTQGKAALAVLLPVVLCCAFMAALLFMGVLAGVAASR